MKRILALTILIISFTACNDDLKNENAALKLELEELKSQDLEKDQDLNDFAGTFAAVQENLKAIREREESIRNAREGGLENAQVARDQVLEDIEAINGIIEKNKELIADLQKKLGNSKSESKKYLKMVENLNRQIEAKDEQIIVLKDDLANLNFKMDQLNSKVGVLTEASMAQRKLIENQTDVINTAYYTIGTYKELKAAGIVNKEGGFIGIGRTETITNDFNKEYFTQIDIRETTTIPIEGGRKKVELLSNHSSNSFVYEQDGESIVAISISNSGEFWKNSKYLVILLD
jgi:predicted  nucleic acid-binding Zn-ribbon protein